MTEIPWIRYLGDGAYAQLLEIPVAVVIYTDRNTDGVTRHWVALEPDAVQTLVDLVRAAGWRIT
jgi:hypothetical protein